MWFTTRLALGALSGLAAKTSVVGPVRAQTTASQESGGRSLILTFAYAGELVQDAAGGSRRGAAFAGAAGVEVTLLLKRLVGWNGTRVFVLALDTHGARWGFFLALFAPCHR